MPAVLLISVLSCAVFGNTWNFSLQFLYQLLVFSVFSFVLISGLKDEKLALEENDFFFFLTALLVALAWAFSPIRSILTWELINFFAGLSIYFAASRIKEEIEKRKILIYFIFSIVALVAVWQFFFYKETYATLKNANTLAFYCLLAGGLALKWGNYYLAGIFAVLIIISKSAGAIAAVFVAALLYAYDKKAFSKIRENAFLFLTVALLVVIAIFSAQKSSVYDRLNWWQAALNMLAQRPLYGWGEGAFAYVSGAFKQQAGLGSVYAHNYYLEFAAQNGLVASLVWFYALFSFLRRSNGVLRYTLAAALAHSFFDFGLSSVYGFWLFCFILGMEKKNAYLKTSKKFLAPAIFLLASLWLSFLSGGFENLRKERLLLNCEKDEKYLQKALEEKERNPRDYNYLSYVSEKMFRKAKEKKDLGLLAESAKTYEQKLIVNPWNPSDYAVLNEIYSLMKEDAVKEELKGRAREYLKWK